MALALQCPDCGHKVPLSGVGAAGTYRCQECGRALKVPQQVDPAPPPPSGAASAAPTTSSSGRSRKAAAKPPKAVQPAAPAVPLPPAGAPAPSVAAGAGLGPAATEVLDLSAIAMGVAGTEPVGHPAAASPSASAADAGAPAPEASGGSRASRSATPQAPLVVRLWWWALWALPLGGLAGAGIARQFGWLTQNDLEGTLLRTEWDRFWPVARMLPLCALIAALVAEAGLRAWNAVTARVGQGVVFRLMGVHVGLCVLGGLMVAFTSVPPLLVAVAALVAWVVVAGVLIRAAAASLRPAPERSAPGPVNPGRRAQPQRRAGS